MQELPVEEGVVGEEELKEEGGGGYGDGGGYEDGGRYGDGEVEDGGRYGDGVYEGGYGDGVEDVGGLVMEWRMEEGLVME